MKSKVSKFINRRMAKVYLDRVDSLMKDTGCSYDFARKVVDTYKAHLIERYGKIEFSLVCIMFVCGIILYLI